MSVRSVRDERELAAYLAHPRGGAEPADALRIAGELLALASDLHGELDELRSDVASLGRRVAALESELAEERPRHSVRAELVPGYCEHGYHESHHCPDCDVPAHLPAVLDRIADYSPRAASLLRRRLAEYGR